ncbi:hypothetical protein [Kamptonema formosum]|nr:hypothetical protein [Oscillatoria sp. PCC 10802]
MDHRREILTFTVGTSPRDLPLSFTELAAGAGAQLALPPFH